MEFNRTRPLPANRVAYEVREVVDTIAAEKRPGTDAKSPASRLNEEFLSRHYGFRDLFRGRHSRLQVTVHEPDCIEFP